MRIGHILDAEQGGSQRKYRGYGKARKNAVYQLIDNFVLFHSQEYSITKEVDASVRHKVNALRTVTGTKSAIHVTFVTPYGLAHNSYAGNVQSEITADDLFA